MKKEVSPMKFTKMQGAGNDFIILDNRSGEISESEYSSLAVTLCRRRISIQPKRTRLRRFAKTP